MRATQDQDSQLDGEWCSHGHSEFVLAIFHLLPLELVFWSYYFAYRNSQFPFDLLQHIHILLSFFNRNRTSRRQVRDSNYRTGFILIVRFIHLKSWSLSDIQKYTRKRTLIEIILINLYLFDSAHLIPHCKSWLPIGRINNSVNSSFDRMKASLAVS